MAYRNKKLLEVIRTMPCAICGAGYPIQAAHSNLLRHGKGMGIKASDAAIFPACPTCHQEIDNGMSMSKNELEELTYRAIADTYVAMMESGRIDVSRS